MINKPHYVTFSHEVTTHQSGTHSCSNNAAWQVFCHNIAEYNIFSDYSYQIFKSSGKNDSKILTLFNCRSTFWKYALSYGRYDLGVQSIWNYQAGAALVQPWSSQPACTNFLSWKSCQSLFHLTMRLALIFSAIDVLLMSTACCVPLSWFWLIPVENKAKYSKINCWEFSSKWMFWDRWDWIHFWKG